jgi:hypothetical protein
MTGSTPSRRGLLRAVGLLGAVGLAGCGGRTGPGTTAAPTTTTTAATTPTPTTTAATTTTPGEQQLRAAARTFVTRLVAGEFEAAADQFGPDLAAQVSPAALGSLWADIQRDAGSFVAVREVTLTTVQSFDAAVVAVRFSRGDRGLRLVFDDRDRVVGIQLVPVGETEWSPPAYVDPDSIETTAVEVAGPGDCGLPGEVTVPASAPADGEESAPLPSFVLLGGSGPTDLDGSVGPNRPYRDIAYGLATTTAASLRYTKRTAACSVDPAALTIDEEYTADALAAIDRLRAAPGAGGDRTVVVGHSLGGLLAPRVAARADGVAGVVMLAPPGRPLQELIVEQTRYVAELDGTIGDDERARIDAVTTAAGRIDDLDIPDGETVLGAGRPYWASLASYDAFETARSLSVPVLALFGGRDYQVTDADVTAWEQALAGQQGATVRRYPELNHLFVPGSGPGTPAEYQQPGHVSATVVADLGEWLSARWAD